jgi:hypothetical protein
LHADRRRARRRAAARARRSDDGFYGAGVSPIDQAGPTLDELFARMAAGGARFTPEEMASAMVRQAMHEAKAAGLLS